MFVQSMRLCLVCLLLPALSFAQTVNLTFRVDMQQEIISPLGVHIAGDFQAPAGVGSNWNPAATFMSDADNDKVYELSVQVPPGTYSYKFVNGNAWGSDENPPAECSVGATNNRIVTVGTGGSAQSKLREAGKSAKESKELIDAMAAVEILELGLQSARSS